MLQISVIIPLYNHEKFIKESISSVLKQTIADFELIIINDGSVDNSEEIVRKVNDERIRYVTQPNSGAHKTINRGIEISRGQYISILNSDDVYLPDRLEKCLNVFENDPASDAVFSGINHIDEDGKSLKITIGAEENWEKHNLESSFKGQNNLTWDLLAGNFLKTTSNLFCRKQCFEKVGLFRNLRYTHDYDFFLRLSSVCNTAIIEEPLLKYRSHPANTLKEGQAAIDLESAVVILDFLMNHDFGTFSEDDNSTFLNKVLNSLNTYRSDRIMLILALFSRLSGTSDDSIVDRFIRDSNDQFWINAHQYLQNYHDGWQAREEILNEWHKLHQLYQKSEDRINEITGSRWFRFEQFVRKWFK